MNSVRACGTILALLGFAGLLAVGDDVRLYLESVGLCCILIAGLILLASEFQLWPIPSVAARFIAIGIVCGTGR